MAPPSQEGGATEDATSDASGQWLGASSAARFGLDIGGTLCKLVFFEPLVLEPTSLPPGVAAAPPNIARQALAAPEATKASTAPVAPGGATKLAGSRHSQPLGHEDSPGGGHSEVSKLNGISLPGGTISFAKRVMPVPILENGTNSFRGTEDETFSPAARDNGEGASFPSLSTTSGSIQAKARLEGSDGGPTGSSSRASWRKFWAASHEPISLPGRGTLHFKRFETWQMEEFLQLTREHSLVGAGRPHGATGGGARKFGDRFLELAGLRLRRADELTCLVRGIDFLARLARDDAFEFPETYREGDVKRPWRSPENSSDEDDDEEKDQKRGEKKSHAAAPLAAGATEQGKAPAAPGGGDQGAGVEVKSAFDKKPKAALPAWRAGSGRGGGEKGGEDSLYPYLVVNIGSGVSILRVDSATSFQRVGGSSLGGSTFLGLTSVLTGCTSFREAIELATRGDSTTVDMLVGDIYGGDYTEMGLAASTVASSFGKMVQPPSRARAVEAPQDLARAALLMVTNNVGSLAMLHSRPSGVRHILFAGSFLHGNKLAMRLLAVAVEFWSEGIMKAVFMRHEGHAGAVGALLSALDEDDPVDSLLLDDSRQI